MIYVLASLMAISLFVSVLLLLNRKIGAIYFFAPLVMSALALTFVQFGLTFATPTGNDLMLGGYPYFASIDGAFDSVTDLIVNRIHHTGLFSTICIVLLAILMTSFMVILIAAIFCAIVEKSELNDRASKFAIIGMSWSVVFLAPYLLIASATGVYKAYKLEGATIPQEGLYALHQLCSPYKSARLTAGKIECGYFNYNVVIEKEDDGFQIESLDTILLEDGDFKKYGLDYKTGEVYMTVAWNSAYDKDYTVYAMIESKKSPPSGNYDDFVEEVNKEFNKLNTALGNDFPFYKPVNKDSVDPKWIENQISD
ncbi:hypothetical protein [Vibrio alginolyticus]|uniref:hypothetical protein n=1 Tax=Vibrio alginolyticus TaxID=663 RepID=UPI0006CA7902|nr:hypothetical protein [Vibrio alginolyticus]KPM98699.1 hypothetical protein AOG25_09870 [Vibrio alginolyticus]CAH7170565.1 conserved membrane hypothetical protein [Vibrio chagasii]